MRNREAGSTSFRIKAIPPFALPTLLGSLPAMLGRGAASPCFVSSLCTHSLSAVPLLLHCWLQRREPVGVRNQPAPVAGGQGEVRSWWSRRKMLELKPAEDGEIKNGLWPAFPSTKLIVLLVTAGRRVVAESLSHFPNGVGHFAPKQTPLLCLSHLQEGCRRRISSCLQPSQGTASLP